MARKKTIIITADRERLEDLFLGDFADAFRDKPYLHHLRGELDSAQVVDSSEVPYGVITMNSTVCL